MLLIPKVQKIKESIKMNRIVKFRSMMSLVTIREHPITWMGSLLNNRQKEKILKKHKILIK